MVKKAGTVTLEGVLKEIEDKNAAPVYLIHGEEDFLVQKSAKKIITTLLEDKSDSFSVEQYDGKSAQVQEISNALFTLPFFGDKKVIFVKEARFLTTPSTLDNQLIDNIVEKGIPSGNILVITNQKVKKTTRFYKHINQNGRILEYSGFEKENRQTLSALYEMVKKTLSESQKTMTRDSFEHLIVYTGLNIRQIMDELEKLIVFTGTGKNEISHDDIDMLIPKSREAVLFKLADTVGEKDIAGSLQLLTDLWRQNENPIGIMVTISSRIRLLLQLKALLTFPENNHITQLRYYNADRIGKWVESIPEQVKEGFPDGKSNNILKQHPYRLFIMLNQVKKFSLEKLIDCYQEIATTSLQLVSTGSDKKLLIELLLTKICS